MKQNWMPRPQVTLPSLVRVPTTSLWPHLGTVTTPEKKHAAIDNMFVQKKGRGKETESTMTSRPRWCLSPILYSRFTGGDDWWWEVGKRRTASTTSSAGQLCWDYDGSPDRATLRDTKLSALVTTSARSWPLKKGELRTGGSTPFVDRRLRCRLEEILHGGEDTSRRREIYPTLTRGWQNEESFKQAKCYSIKNLDTVCEKEAFRTRCMLHLLRPDLCRPDPGVGGRRVRG